MSLPDTIVRFLPTEGVNVLIADDHPVFRRGLREAIEERKPT